MLVRAVAVLHPGRRAAGYLAQEVLDALVPAEAGRVDDDEGQRLEHDIEEDPLAHAQVVHFLFRFQVGTCALVRHERLEERCHLDRFAIVG